MVLVLLLIFALSFLFLFFYKQAPRILNFLGGLSILGVFIYFSTHIQAIINGHKIIEEVPWIPSLLISFRFYLDGLSLFFALLISFFGFFIFLYSIRYMRGKPKTNRFFFYLTIFFTSMLGLVLSDHLILLYVFWEVTSVSSYLLIGYNNKKKKAREAALKALLLTNLGGLILFAGLLLLGQQYGTFYLSIILQINQAVVGTTAAAFLILTGCFTKSAQFPFHFWLPSAMEAPSPVSAYLHSATMVKAGIFLIMRLNPLFGDNSLWQMSLLFIGVISMLLGVLKATTVYDLKEILAYITISTLGLLIAALSVGNHLAMQGAVIYLLAHALYKASLFLIAGNLDKQIATRDLRNLSGLFQYMPLTGLTALGACMALAGLPPFLGFGAKELLYEALSGDNWQLRLMLIALVFTNAIYVALALKFFLGVFFGSSSLKNEVKEVSLIMWFPAIVLAMMGGVLGVGGIYLEAFITTISEVIMPGSGLVKVDLSLWHGFNISFILSIITWLSGVILYFLLNTLQGLAQPNSFSFHLGYQCVLQITQRLAFAATRFLQPGFLTWYLKVIFGVLIILLAWTYAEGGLFSAIDFPIRADLFPDIYVFFPLLLVFSGTISILTTSSRLRILVCLSLVGYGIALFYAINNAPDVSMTQFLVETITLVIFTVVLNRMPKSATFPMEARKILIATIAVAFGIIMILILFSLQDYEAAPLLKDFYLQHSVPEGHGENIVNVMLVDFRAFDTLGEMIVLSMTAFGVAVLIKLKSKEDIF